MARKGDIAFVRAALEDLKLAIQREAPPPSAVEQIVKTKRRPPERTLKYPGTESSVSRSGIYGQDTTEVKPMYDLAEVIRLQDIESYFAVAIDRHVELIMKQGFLVKGRDPETVAYVKRRLREIALISDQPFVDMVRELVRNIVATSNGYMVFYRDSERSSGVRTRMWGRERDPIAGVSIADPSTVTIKQTKSGRPALFIQRVKGYKERQWPHHDVVHIPWRKKSGHAFGTPFVIPALEDIRALRKLEMVTEHIAHKYAFPMMHWKVGSEKIPAGKVTDHATGQQVAEVLIAAQYAEQLAQEGFVVTSERHEVKIIGAEGEALDLQPFIDHYELRVIAGLRLSMMDLGRGDTANRGTATTLSQILVDSCTEIQSLISDFVTERFFDHIVMEGGYNLSDGNRVHFLFPAIDDEAERAEQNHGLQLYVQGGITRAEFRRDYLHLDDLTPEEEGGLYLNEWLIPLAKAQAAIKAAAAKKPGIGSSAAGVGGMLGNKTRPANQHGKAMTAPRLPANDSEAQVRIIWNRCSEAVIQYVKDGKDVRPAFTQALRDIGNMLEDDIRTEWRSGISKAYTELKKPAPVLLSEVLNARELHQVDQLLLGFRTKDLQQIQAACMLQSSIEVRTGLARSSSVVGSVMAAFASSWVLLDARIGRIRRAAQIIGYLQAYRAAGHDNVKLGTSETAEVLDIREMQERPDIVRSISLTSRLQDAALPIFLEEPQ